jgi:hypothetical protein
LVGRRPEPGDAGAHVEFYGDPRTPEELWPADLRTPEHARATLEEFIERWQRWGFGVYRLVRPAPARAIPAPGNSPGDMAGGR